MTLIVLDASITTGWLLEDEQDSLSLAVFETAKRDGARVPQHWRFEVANSLLFAERRNRLRPGRAMFHLKSLDDLSIQVDGSPDLAEILDLAFEHGLTFNDAVYLELAMRHELPLATLDHDLERAARSAGIEVVSA